MRDGGPIAREDEAAGRHDTGLLAVLERIRRIDPGHARVSLEHVLEAAGRNSFGALILLAGLVTLAPLVGDIPGVPTLMAILVALTAVQLFIGRTVFWLPRWMVDRSLTRRNLDRALRGCAPPARFIDRLCRPRLTWAVRGAGRYLVASVALFVALLMPAMEFIPFSANGAGFTLTVLGLAILEDDGLLALIALGLILLTLLLIWLFFGSLI